MPSRNSSATDEALRLIDKKGLTAYRAAKEVGINLSTIYRALKRRKASQEGVSKQGKHHAQN